MAATNGGMAAKDDGRAGMDDGREGKDDGRADITCDTTASTVPKTSMVQVYEDCLRSEIRSIQLLKYLGQLSIFVDPEVGCVRQG